MNFNNVLESICPLRVCDTRRIKQQLRCFPNKAQTYNGADDYETQMHAPIDSIQALLQTILLKRRVLEQDSWPIRGISRIF
jgi:hypothetical protein